MSALSDPANWVISDGRSQAQRRLPALDQTYFKPNDFSFEQLLAMAQEYAGLARFVELDGVADGATWQHYFQHDLTVLLATILVIDVDQVRSNFARRAQPAPTPTQRQAAFDFDFGYNMASFRSDTPASALLLARLLDDWQVRLAKIGGGLAQDLLVTLRRVLLGIQPQLQAMVQNLQDEAVPVPGRVGSCFSAEFLQLANVSATFANTPDAGIFYVLCQAISIVQRQARRLLPLSLVSGEHDPGTGLLIAFIQLFQKLQAPLNRFGPTALDFYYRQVLQFQPDPSHTNSAFLLIRPQSGIGPLLVEKGCQFLASLDAAQPDMVLQAEEASWFSDAQVRALYTLYFKMEQKTQPPNRRLLGCYQDQIPLARDDAAGASQQRGWPLLGEPRAGRVSPSAQVARFGFAIASKVLLLAEGERSITVTWYWRPDSFKVSDEALKQFQNLFRIEVTTATGWVGINQYVRPAGGQVGQSTAPNAQTFALTFALPAGFAPIVGWQAALHGADCASKLPLLRFILRHDSGSAGDQISKAALLQMRIDVDVRGCRQLALYNQFGQLDPAATMQPFGPAPKLGAYFIVGCAEIQCKTLKTASIDVVWRDLPVGAADFRHCYADYHKQQQSNASFLAQPAVLAGGKWLLDQLLPWLNLFDGKPGAGKPALTLSLTQSGPGTQADSLPMDPLLPLFQPLSSPPDGDFGYNDASQSGFFKLTLMAPDGAFGHQAYPNLLQETMYANAAAMMANAATPPPDPLQPLVAAPNPPYTPELGAVSFNYSASALIRFDAPGVDEDWQDQLILLYPLGVACVRQTGAAQLLPTPLEAGNLLIGISARQLEGPLSLYFDLQDDSLPRDSGSGSAVIWYYMAANRWLALAASAIVHDGTDGFMGSGIIRLHLPSGISTDNSVMPAGLAWLRVAANTQLTHFGSVKRVLAQALKVNWQAASVSWPALMRAGAILHSKLPGVAQVVALEQARFSQPQEPQADFYTRISERLSHKNRALLPVDYERLILTRFPQVFKVKCFANLGYAIDNPGQRSGGHILIIVLPYFVADGPSGQKPMLSGKVLIQVQQFIAALAAPNASIVVQNPRYEEVQVRCRVVLKPNRPAGYCIRQINQALSDFLSPWHPAGGERHFGWRVRKPEISTFLQAQDCVAAVLGVAMLRITPKNNFWEDQYIINISDDNPASGDFFPAYPWGVAVPMPAHIVEVMPDQPPPLPKTTMGVDMLEVGSTFVISAKP